VKENKSIIKVWLLAYTSVNGRTYEEKGFPFKPIPLTEEWLLKFGFEENRIIIGESLWLELDFNSPTYPHYNIFVKQLNTDLMIDSVLMDIELKHVHSLQNLYFALTNEELIIK
jgi:hypothetical protein